MSGKCVLARLFIQLGSAERIHPGLRINEIEKYCKTISTINLDKLNGIA
jgi:hypothetical protein